MLLYVHRDHQGVGGVGEAQDGHLDFHTAPELSVDSKLLSGHDRRSG